MRAYASLLFVVTALGCALLAQSALTTERHAAADAAGSLALHLCTGYFSTEAPRSLIVSLINTVALPTAPATSRTEVDDREKTVSVHYANDMPPRVAVQRGVLGCTLMPIGATKGAAVVLRKPALRAPNLDDRPWPTGEGNATGRLSGDQTAAVERVLDEAFKNEASIYRGVSWGVVVVKDGKIVAERYQQAMEPHLPARTNSMCKGLGATLVGIGVHKGLLDLDRKAPLSEWRTAGDPRGEITLNDLMHMTSGLYSESAAKPDSFLYLSGAPVSEIAARHSMDSRPGARFVYAGADSVLAVRALREAVNDDAAFMTFPHRELLWKIGMTRTIVETDWNGDFIVSGQCWSTPRDFARLGLLYLADGVWNGERLLPVGWSKYVATPASAQPQRPSIGGDAGYGAQFWLHGGLEGLPADAYAAFGSRGQYMMIIPSQTLVIVRRGFDGDAPFNVSKFSADVSKALVQ